MFKLAEARERRTLLAVAVRALLDNNPGATWKPEHQAKYDANMAEIEAIDAEISRNQKALDLDAEVAFNTAGGREREAARGEKPMADKLFDKWCRVGDKGLNDDEQRQIFATMSTGTGSEGGFTVPTTVAGSILDAMKAYGGMRAVSEVFRTASGETMNWPTSDGTNEEGEIIAENQQANDGDANFGVKALTVYKFSSKVITVPWELLQDSTADIEAFIRGRLVQRLGRITNRKFTVGSGAGEPHGIVTVATNGKTGAISATPAITYDDLVDTEHSVDPAYRASGRWMFHDDMLKLIRKVKDSQNRPIFVPGYESGNPGGAPDRLLNRNIVINQHMPVPAASAKSILFGDFSYYKIRDVMQVSLFRFADSAYTKKGQVGFLAWARSGGNLVDVGGAVKTFTHGAAS